MAAARNDTQALAEAAVAASSSNTTSTTASKPRRVRTGCLTCRERHLKCDETFPGDCLNCQKSQRECKRGVKLNFIDTKCDKIPEVARVPRDQRERGFVDESREIASEYMGGLQSYGNGVSASNEAQKDAAARNYSISGAQESVQRMEDMSYGYNAPVVHNMAQQQAPLPNVPDAQLEQYRYHLQQQQQMQNQQQQQQMRSQQQQQQIQDQQQQQQMQNQQLFHQQQQQQQQQQQEQERHMSMTMEQAKPDYEPMSLLNSATSSSISAVAHPHPAYRQSQQSIQEEEQSEIRDILNTAEETLFMQVFVEEVGLWMDSMDSMKHVSLGSGFVSAQLTLHSSPDFYHSMRLHNLCC